MKRAGPFRRRVGLKRRSAKGTAQDKLKGTIRAGVFKRDGRTCRAKYFGYQSFPPCFGPLTVHHIVKASQGGQYVASNLVTLCAFHNDLIESDANFAKLCHDAGLVRKGWEA